jgi:hypothetical protein
MPPDLSRRAFLTGAGACFVGMGLAGNGGVACAARAMGRRPPLSPLVLSSDLYVSPEPQRLAFAIAKGARFASGAPARVALAPPGNREGPVYPTELHRAGLP